MNAAIADRGELTKADAKRHSTRSMRSSWGSSGMPRRSVSARSPS
jgi:hypothetical protein